MVIWFVGEQHGNKQLGAQVTMAHTVYVDHLIENGVTTRLAGDVDLGDTKVYVATTGEDLAVDDATHLANLIGSAATSINAPATKRGELG